ncbi:MAG: amino acid ABC transporter permease [SAR116 cluster bacterium]|nr:MAG: amino acid ABC transporter permease [SAR116 cluster bacterium]|tara:strand:- start:2467 stop:3363 length:897 start_codon:yes stop_codon:yes gene_type:complete
MAADRRQNSLPGVNARASTDLPVMKPLRLSAAGPTATQWLANLPWWTPILLMTPLILFPFYAQAAGKFTIVTAFATLVKWIPFLFKSGFLFNILISMFAMLFGTLAGAALGLGQISKIATIRRSAWFLTQLFRNSPWLVILFIVLLALPFEVVIFGYIISIPDWMKAVFGLSLPIMANISEIVRGAVQSVPTAQWEASESLAFSRQQTLWRIILPQCFKRMIPPWMNWYAILTMATPLCSLLGVEEIITLSRQAMEAENNHPELLVPFYSFALALFFFYCYPIARVTIALERRYAVKL